MNLILGLNPKIDEGTAQMQHEPQAPRADEEFGKNSVARCECLCCKGGIEFEPAKFLEKLRTNLLVFGQEIKCPHCGRITSIYIENKLGRVFKPVSLTTD
jgi:hypothetical protein